MSAVLQELVLPLALLKNPDSFPIDLMFLSNTWSIFFPYALKIKIWKIIFRSGHPEMFFRKDFLRNVS